MPARTVGRITSRAAFAELQRSRARGASGPVRVTFVPADDRHPGVFPQVATQLGAVAAVPSCGTRCAAGPARSCGPRRRRCPGAPIWCGSTRPRPRRTPDAPPRRGAGHWRRPAGAGCPHERRHRGPAEPPGPGGRRPRHRLPGRRVRPHLPLSLLPQLLHLRRRGLHRPRLLARPGPERPPPVALPALRAPRRGPGPASGVHAHERSHPC